jgi:Ca2+/H+ antiporter, TMEM165/GDT1 family
VDTFLHTALLVGLAELGDKTQFMALAFGARYSWRLALAGVGIGILLIQLLSVAAGEIVGSALPRTWVGLAAGAAFIAFGLVALRGARDDSEEHEVSTPRRAGALARLVTVVSTFVLSELGDKTQLMALVLASQARQFLTVWLGASAGMLLVDGSSVLLGGALSARLPEGAIRLGSATIFVLFGLWTLAETFGLIGERR